MPAFTTALIERALTRHGLEYRKGDGACLLELGFDDIGLTGQFVLALVQDDIFHIVGGVQRVIAQQDWQRALVVCNGFHASKFWGARISQSINRKRMQAFALRVLSN
jgi:hypothetical protein